MARLSSAGPTSVPRPSFLLSEEGRRHDARVDLGFGKVRGVSSLLGNSKDDTDDASLMSLSWPPPRLRVSRASRRTSSRRPTRWRGEVWHGNARRAQSVVAATLFIFKPHPKRAWRDFQESQTSRNSGNATASSIAFSKLFACAPVRFNA